MTNEQIFVYCRWSRNCPEMKDKVTESWATEYSVHLDGGLIYQRKQEGGGPEEYRAPGVKLVYKCADQYFIDDKSNPDQTLRCFSNRHIPEKNASWYEPGHFTQFKRCFRKYTT